MLKTMKRVVLLVLVQQIGEYGFNFKFLIYMFLFFNNFGDSIWAEGKWAGPTRGRHTDLRICVK